MRFYEYEARKIVELAGIPVTKYGFCTTPEEAREAAEEIGGPVGDQVAGAERRPDEGRRRQVRRHARGGRRARRGDPRARDQRPACRAASSSTRKPRSSRSTTPGVVWDGTAKRPLMLFSDMGGIDIEEVAETHPDHVGRGHVSNLLPIADFEAKQAIAATGVTGSQLNRATPVLARLARLFRDNDMTLAEINPLAELDRRQLRRPRRPHGDGERGGRPPEGAAPQAARDRRGRHPRDLRALRLRAQRRRDRRRRPPRRDPGQGPRLRGQPRPRDRRRRRLADADRRGPQPGRQARQLLGDRRQPLGRQGLRPGQGGAREGRRREDRGDDVDRLQHPGRHRRPRRDQGLPRARQGPRRDDRDLPHPRRLGGGGLQDPRPLRGRVLRPLGLDVGGGGPRRRQDPGSAADWRRRMSSIGWLDEHPADRRRPSSSRGSPGARRST